MVRLPLRVKPGSTRKAEQFQYHIPIELTYTVVPLIIVAIVFGFAYSAENHVNKVSRTPTVKITVESFQWGWRFIYPNGHAELGTVSNALDINTKPTCRCCTCPPARRRSSTWSPST